MTTIERCPGCGYPKFGPGLCAFCLPTEAVDQMADSAGDDDATSAAAVG